MYKAKLSLKYFHFQPMHSANRFHLKIEIKLCSGHDRIHRNFRDQLLTQKKNKPNTVVVQDIKIINNCYCCYFSPLTKPYNDFSRNQF